MVEEILNATNQPAHSHGRGVFCSALVADLTPPHAAGLRGQVHNPTSWTDHPALPRRPNRGRPTIRWPAMPPLACCGVGWPAMTPGHAECAPLRFASSIRRSAKGREVVHATLNVPGLDRPSPRGARRRRPSPGASHGGPHDLLRGHGDILGFSGELIAHRPIHQPGHLAGRWPGAHGRGAGLSHVALSRAIAARRSSLNPQPSAISPA
jgi:hypothetical protein